MIVARGLGRATAGAAGIIAAAGLGLFLLPVMVGGVGNASLWRPSDKISVQELRLLLDDRDLLELVPIIVEVLNGRH